MNGYFVLQTEQLDAQITHTMQKQGAQITCEISVSGEGRI